MAQSLREQRQRGSASVGESNIGLDDEGDEDFERVIRTPENMAAKAAAVVGGSPGVQQPSPHDLAHLEGTTQNEFEARQQKGQREEKTTQERTEEQIVMEYVKKQSLLEMQHQNKAKGRATATGTATEDKDDR
ncbi:hypothetical protein G647_05734 [Cladophialophora carrionii CBS 160.54]|uniref:Uncharacterized protein n=1 Tax=Cladophialophora carrionii CBS 160.54 TaxID=1279043 RepID=V9DDA7_9EURO|nr:uncharacterized protein G647_05734 [Cladophialophora carrionii CBS 160.54]ETI23927.1 hypothetical protein G647_05734 [Cladophialophora carrionii CBS 160.54]